MKIKLITIGKTDASYLKEGEALYENRLKHYLKFERIDIPELKKVKNLSKDQIKEKEGILLLSKLETSDFVVLLDEKGKQYTSREFSELYSKRAVSGCKCLLFIIGGAYGFSKDVYQRANQQLSFSKMTFSHQMIRLFFLEQLYRSQTILNNEPYHHD